jgi:hypothetical protein
MLSFANVLDLFVNKFAGLGCWAFAFAGGLSRPLDCSFLGQDFSS